MPTVIFIAGPNGADKTTFANEYLSEEEKGFPFVNADEIAREFANQPGQGASDIRAGRIMLDRIDELAHAGADFVVETALASLTYARKIPVWRERGYRVSLVYVQLGSVAESMERVSKRVRAAAMAFRKMQSGGALKSLAYLETYKPIVDAWYMWEKVGTAIRPPQVVGTTMTKGLDVAKMKAAFKRAAHKALHGTREERSGRFLLKREERQRVSGERHDGPTGPDRAERKV